MSEQPLDGRHLVITPVDLDAAAAEHVYVHLPQRGTTPVAADPVWGALADAGTRVVVLAYNPVERTDGFDQQATVEAQLAALLGHLAETAPADGWQSFMADEQVEWPNVFISGNRDGADVALAIADSHPVGRAVFFSGPTEMPAKAQAANDTRYAFGHTEDELESRQAIWTAAGVPEPTKTITGEVDPTGNRFVSELALTDGFNERNDWQNRRYIALWQYFCCS